MTRRRPFALLPLLAAAAIVLSACTGSPTVVTPTAPETSDATDAATNLVAADGLVIGDGPLSVELWTDLSCPHCAILEESTGADLQQWVDDGDITLTIHPMNYVSAKRGDTTEYSTRAANLLGLTADAGEYDALLPLYALLQANQVDADGAPTDDDLLAFAEAAGVTADLGEGVRDRTMAAWVQESNDHWLQAVVGSDTTVDHVPLLVVDGITFDIREDGTDADRLRAAVEAAKG